jgi:tRNA nucleotidyltransferase (CCA-adding enzyme)
MDEFQLASSIAERARAAGGRALFVGGWVRDRLLGRDSKDIDLEVYGIEADRLRALLEEIGPVNTVGESFTVYRLARSTWPCPAPNRSVVAVIVGSW